MDDTVCVINIGPAQRRRRRNLGVVSLAVGVVVVLGAWSAVLPRTILLPSAVFFFVGFSGVFQSRAKT
ncbi:MAG: hypothetical protein FJ207_07935 [Gemmatimonadetes bacterium]|nr:hypothetical protein [Gemmatimonadota bacterium]